MKIVCLVLQIHRLLICWISKCGINNVLIYPQRVWEYPFCGNNKTDNKTPYEYDFGDRFKVTIFRKVSNVSEKVSNARKGK